MESALYEGSVRHRRFEPFDHSFEYDVFMVYLDLDELDTVFESVPGWSTKDFSLAWFREEDHFANTDRTLSNAVRDRVETRTGHRPGGPIRLLTNLRYFGYCFNPVSFYFCFDEKDQALETLVPEVSNTPWRDMYSYVLSVDDGQSDDETVRFYFDKEFFVSPFMPPDPSYLLECSRPGDTQRIHMESFRNGECVFDATMDLQRQSISRNNLV